jgi:hypothetical protein
MTEIPFRSHLDIIRQREEEFVALLERGQFSPLLLQQVFGTFFLLLVPLLVRHKGAFHSNALRYGLFAVICGFAVHTILQVRVIGMGNGYGVGIITAWFLVWSSTLLIFNDAQRDFKRIEKEYVDENGDEHRTNPKTNGSAVSSGTSSNADCGIKTRTQRTSQLSPSSSTKTPKCKVYRWQPYPHSNSHRLDWVSDLIFNFRGPNWNWRIRSLPPLPNAVVESSEGRAHVSETVDPQIDEASWTRIRYAFRSFIRDYVALDIIKVLMNRDPYFWGLAGYNPPPPLPFSLLSFSPPLVRVYRLLLSMIGVVFALDIILSLNPLFFLGLSLAFPRFSRKITHQPLEEAWMYPEAFGSVNSALENGLAGAWNVWWHQLFRFGFSETSRWVTDLFLSNDEAANKSPLYKQLCRLIQVVVAFSVSGMVHAFGSYTQFAETKPLQPFLFFLLQAFGILLQRFLTCSIIPRKVSSKTPAWLKRAANLIFVSMWFYFTGPLIVDDFSRGGMWLFEPLPVSPLRGLGLGADGEGWVCWRGPFLSWWSGKTWWQSGFRIV